MDCPNCGCRDLRTYKTVQLAKAVRRLKRCRHCGRNVTTLEQQPVHLETLLRFGGGAEKLDQQQEAALAVLNGEDPQAAVDALVKRERRHRKREKPAGLDPAETKGDMT
jgi:transcriptional regulator NrdR family protein